VAEPRADSQSGRPVRLSHQLSAHSVSLDLSWLIYDGLHLLKKLLASVEKKGIEGSSNGRSKRGCQHKILWFTVLFSRSSFTGPNRLLRTSQTTTSCALVEKAMAYFQNRV
jgi:hypothetical protein